jgi:hypothetical protein
VRPFLLVLLLAAPALAENQDFLGEPPLLEKLDDSDRELEERLHKIQRTLDDLTFSESLRTSDQAPTCDNSDVLQVLKSVSDQLSQCKTNLRRAQTYPKLKKAESSE